MTIFDAVEQWCSHHDKTISAFGAVSTFLVVLVTVWLALRRPKVRLHVLTGIRQLTRPPAVPIEHVLVRIVNLGPAMTTITGIGWATGFWRFGTFLEQLSDLRSPDRDELHAGQHVAFYFRLDGVGRDALREIALDLKKSRLPLFLSMRLVRVQVYANHRVAASKRIDKLIRGQLHDLHLLLAAPPC